MENTENTIITISENGAVVVPHRVCMKDFDIAHLLGITYPAVRGKIRTLLKSGRYEYYGCGGEIMRNGMIMQEIFGLDMVIAVAFQVNTYQADIFKKYVMRKILKGESLPIFISMGNAQSRDINLC